MNRFILSRWCLCSSNSCVRVNMLASMKIVAVQVVWLRPTEDQDSWFNIFVLHQNRVQHYKTGPGQKARSIQEADLPEWLDMVCTA